MGHSMVFISFQKVSGGSSTNHLNTESIWIPNVKKFNFWMVIYKMAAIL